MPIVTGGVVGGGVGVGATGATEKFGVGATVACGLDAFIVVVEVAVNEVEVVVTTIESDAAWSAAIDLEVSDESLGTKASTPTAISNKANAAPNPISRRVGFRRLPLGLSPTETPDTPSRDSLFNSAISSN